MILSCLFQQQQIDLLKQSLITLKQKISDKKVDSLADSSLKQLASENSKLKHRLAVLNRVSINISEGVAFTQ